MHENHSRTDLTEGPFLMPSSLLVSPVPRLLSLQEFRGQIADSTVLEYIHSLRIIRCLITSAPSSSSSPRLEHLLFPFAPLSASYHSSHVLEAPVWAVFKEEGIF